MNLPNTKELLGKQLTNVLVLIIAGLVTSLLLAFPIKWLWNGIVPDLFGLPEISAVQAWGLTFLARLIFPVRLDLNKQPIPKT